jgi:retron-type reverse transcriptase
MMRWTPWSSESPPGSELHSRRGLRSYFDTVNHTWLTRFLKHRINDPRMIRLIQKWLKAGILEDGIVTINETGTGQGSAR